MLNELLSPDRIFLGLVPRPKPELLRDLAGRLAELGIVADADALGDRLIQREDMITTGVKRGFAFPHVFSPQVEALTLTLAGVKGGTDFNSLDGEPVEFIFLLIGPLTHQDLHLRVLARISNVARAQGMLEALREADSPEAVIDLLTLSDRQLATLHAATS